MSSKRLEWLAHLELACGRIFVSHFSWNFSSFILVLGGRLCTKILVFRVPQTLVYVLNPIRLTNLDPILRIHEWNIWFLSHMISFYFHANHAFLVPIAIDMIWLWSSSIMSLWFCPKIQPKQIFSIIYQLFDLIQFLINKKSK